MVLRLISLASVYKGSLRIPSGLGFRGILNAENIRTPGRWNYGCAIGRFASLQKLVQEGFWMREAFTIPDFWQTAEACRAAEMAGSLRCKYSAPSRA